MTHLPSFLYRLMVALSSACFFMTVSAAIGMGFFDIYAFHWEHLEGVVFYLKEIVLYNFAAALLFLVVDALYRFVPLRSDRWFFNTLMLSVIGSVFICTIVFFHVEFKGVVPVLFVILLVFFDTFAIIEIAKDLFGVTDEDVHKDTKISTPVVVDGSHGHHANSSRGYVTQQLDEALSHTVFNVDNASYRSSEPTTLLTHRSNDFDAENKLREILAKSTVKSSDKENG